MLDAPALRAYPRESRLGEKCVNLGLAVHASVLHDARIARVLPGTGGVERFAPDRGPRRPGIVAPRHRADLGSGSQDTSQLAQRFHRIWKMKQYEDADGDIEDSIRKGEPLRVHRRQKRAATSLRDAQHSLRPIDSHDAGMRRATAQVLEELARS